MIVVASTIALGIFLFMEYRISSNKDAIVSDLQALGIDAFQYTQRPVAMGGGDGSYDGYSIPVQLISNDNGSYSLAPAGGSGGQGVGPGNSTSTHGQGHGYGYGHARGGTNSKRGHKGTLTLVGVSSQGYGTVTMVINDSSRITTVTFSGKFE